MADIALVFPVKRVKLTEASGIDALELDASLSESHEYETDVTEHPVEGGSNVVDHLRNKPHTLTIEGIVSNTPIMQGSEVEKLGGFVKGANGRAETAFATLMRLRDAQALITVATRLKTYEDMAITSIKVPREAKTGDALRFTITFKHVRIVESKFVSYSREPRGKKKASLGDKNKKESPEYYKQSRSVALNLKDGAVNLGKRLFGGGN